MWKQSLWFAVIGSVVAVLATGAGDLIFLNQSVDVFNGGSTFATRYQGPGWVQIGAIATTGAVLGALIGVAAYWSGVRTVAESGTRVGRVVAAGLVGVGVGLTPVLLMVANIFSGLEDGYSVAVEPSLLLTLYGVSVVLGYGVAVLAVRVALSAADDEFAARTTRYVAVLLPVGGLLATVCGVGTGWLYGFATRPYTGVSVTLVVALILSATFATARLWAVQNLIHAWPTGTRPRDVETI